jgi:hypothetical protein
LNIITEKVTAEVSSKLDEKLEAFFEKFRYPTSNDKDKNDQGNIQMVEKTVQERVDNITGISQKRLPAFHPTWKTLLPSPFL